MLELLLKLLCGNVAFLKILLLFISYSTLILCFNYSNLNEFESPLLLS
jgi:hypothetical protein